MEIDALKAGKRVAQLPPQPGQKGTQVYYPEPPSDFVRPTPSELRKLYDTVVAKYPLLGARGTDTDAHFSGFTSSFEFLGHVGRAAALDHKHYLSYWADQAKDWLERYRPSLPTTSIGLAFMATVVAHADIAFTLADPGNGVVPAIGITAFGGRKASDKWTDVLSGKLLAQTRPARM